MQAREGETCSQASLCQILVSKLQCTDVYLGNSSCSDPAEGTQLQEGEKDRHLFTCVFLLGLGLKQDLANSVISRQ